MIAIGQPILDRGRMGLVVLDANQIIAANYGELVDWLAPGARAVEALPPLVGLEDVLADIAVGTQPSFRLPRISWETPFNEDRVFSLEIIPADQPGMLHLLLRDETDTAKLEQDIIQQRNQLALTHEALAQAKEQAEHALREKAVFLANVSHDLKTPLQVIMGNADILKSNLPEAERSAFLQDILDNSDYLLTLITDLLEASAIEAGQLALAEEQVDIDQLLRQILAMAKRLPGGSSRQFAFTADDEVPFVHGDPMRLKRLLLNIVSNAVKFTSEGGQVAINRAKAEDGGVKLEVCDNGCGIGPDVLGHVFEPFTRSGAAEGSGLGLHIAKGLATLHDADLTLSSQLGIGTKVTLSLPKSRLVDRPS